MMSKRTLLSLLAAIALQAHAQSPRTEHTFQLDGDTRPQATLTQVAWLAGSWEGEAFGERFEEVWNPASGGSMVGMFKLMNGDDVGFYELMLLVEEEGSLSLKVKHFNPDFSAWEDKKDYVDFKLVKVEPDAVHFSGLSFYRRGDDAIDGYIVMRTNDGAISEEKLVYRRVR